MENQPLTVIESLMSGTTVIGYDVGGIKEMAITPHVMTANYGKILDIEKLIIELNNKNSKEIQQYAFMKYSKNIFLSQHEKVYLK
jgi:glycosyltransferase involved in cell wall biosynthesis